MYWLPVVAWMIVIFLLSSRHSVTVSPEYFLNFVFFKTLHIIEYAILFTLTTRALYRGGAGMMGRDVYVWAFIMTLVYAMSDELHQQFVPSRQGHLRDVIIDGVGAGLTWYYLSQLLPKAPKKLRNLAKNLDIPY
jgi:VanZ family protein